MRRAIDAAGYREVKTPQVMDARQWEQSGHWGKYRENMFVIPDEVPNTEDEGPLVSDEAEWMALKPMNCPAHVLIFKQGIKSLPRPAAAALRERLLPPQRAARRAARADAGAPVHPGRRAHLLPRGPDRRRGARVLRAGRPHLPRLRLHLRDQARAAPRAALRHRRRCGTRPRPSCATRCVAAGLRDRGIRLGGTARRRRVLRAQARMAPDRRDRPHLAGRHDPVRPRAARAARRQLHRRGRREAPPGHAPPRDLRHATSASSAS